MGKTSNRGDGKMNTILAKIPFLGKKLYLKEAKKVAAIEKEKSKLHNYEDFKTFLLDCPTYQIEKNNLLRKCMVMLGIEFQQVVFIDQSSSKDKTAWLRNEGAILMHGTGTYLKPWESQKEIIYYDVTDMRPLIDKTKDMDWYNPDACADVVTSITNSKTLQGMNGDNDKKYIFILLVAVALCIILTVVGIYQGIETQKMVAQAFTNLNTTISGLGQ